MIAAIEPQNDDSKGLRLLNVSALAGCLSISVRQAYRWNKAGLVPAPLRIGGVVRWRADEVSRWLESGAPPGGEWELKRDAELATTAEAGQRGERTATEQ